MGNSKDAVKAFTESCRLNPGQYDVLCNLGIALGAQNDCAAAEQAFREATLLQPSDPRPLAYAGVIYAKNQKWDDALRNLSRAVERTPDNPRLQTALALAELHTAGPDAAVQRLQSVIKQHPDYTPALFDIASIDLHWAKNQSEAKRWFESYLGAADPGAFTALAHAALRAIAGTDREKVRYTPLHTPDRAAADKNFQKALTYHKKNDLTNAVKWYIAAVEADDTHAQAFYNLGLAYYAENRLELAADAFTHAVRLNPAFTAARYNSALTKYRLGYNAQARSELKIVLDQQPGYQPAIDLMNRIGK
jgi:tetratricopeptide (TPR) repeat protein